MKKALSLLLVVAMCFSILVTTASCSFKHPIDKFKDKMEKADSYQIALTAVDIPSFGTFTMTTKVDGNIQYVPAVMLDEEYYIETVDGVEYKYTKDDSGKWVKEKYTKGINDSNVLGYQSIHHLFKSGYYEKVKGEKTAYKQTDDVVFADFKDVKIIIEDDSCTIEAKASSKRPFEQPTYYEVKIVISKINEIELTLPSVN